jgi:hypothetical protein
MRRAACIAVTIVAVLLLVTPFDCFAGALTAEAAACCLKGKCVPERNADECCKSGVATGAQLLASKVHRQSSLVPNFAILNVTVALPLFFLPATSGINRASLALRSPPGSRRNLSLLI